MKTFTLALSLAVTAISPAFADDQGGKDLDSKSAKKKARKSAVIREVERGVYVKADAGVLAFLGPRGAGSSANLEPGTVVSLTVGQDFIDKEKASAAWEIFFHQSLNNGQKYFAQQGDDSNLIQGDIHTFTPGIAFEYSVYPTRRIGIGARVGGGVTFSPLLMDEEEYKLAVITTSGWNVDGPLSVHQSPHPMFFAGPTIEYYTKLSHFSVGIDANFAFILGLDFGINGTGYMKYTF